MVDPWINLDSETLGDYSVFRLRRDRDRSADGSKTSHFYVLEAPAWINVVPVTRDGQVVMIRQYRHGTREITPQPGRSHENDFRFIFANECKGPVEIGFGAILCKHGIINKVYLISILLMF